MTSLGAAPRPSPIAGMGLFALQDFLPQERIAPYLGPLTETPPPATAHRAYCLQINEGLWLDGSSAENPSRWANHSCAPNADLVYFADEKQAWLIAQKPIKQGSEITFDYGFTLAESLFHPCHCQEPSCIGRIIATPLRPALLRHLRFSRARD